MLLAILALAAHAEDYVISTKNTMMVLSGKQGERLNFVYYGPTASVSDIRATGNAVNWGAYPTFGTHCTAEHAMLVTHPNGDNSLELAIEEVKQYKENEANVTEFIMKDKVFPLYVSILYKAIPDVDVIKVSTVITN